MKDEDLATIYKRANGEDVGKAQPITTARVFKAMRAMLAQTSSVQKCERCNGAGETTVLSGGGPDAYDVAINCPACNGTGAPPLSDPDMRAICAALGFDPTNHHNAAKCPYCRPAAQAVAHDDYDISPYFAQSPAKTTQPKVPSESETAMANYTLTIVADSGYRSTTEGRCNALQYGAAVGALHGITKEQT